MDMRLRIPELLEAKGVSPYRLSRESGGRISMSTVYRLKRERGHLDTYRRVMLDALCDVLGVPPGDLWERDGPSPAPSGKPARPKGKPRRSPSSP
jgi:DNA-binding Xre family transcriptional regulator